MLRINLLGPVAVLDGAEELSLGSSKERAVLARLALRPGSFVTTAQLVEWLWDDDPPASARKSLRRTCRACERRSALST